MQGRMERDARTALGGVGGTSGPPPSIVEVANLQMCRWMPTRTVPWTNRLPCAPFTRVLPFPARIRWCEIASVNIDEGSSSKGLARPKHGPDVRTAISSVDHWFSNGSIHHSSGFRSS